MEEHVHKFLGLLSYVDYIKDERIKIQSFLGSLPQIFRYMIEFINPPTLYEGIRMEMHYYEKRKGKLEVHPTWRGNTKGRFGQRRSGFKPPFKNQLRNFQQGQQA